MKLHEIKSEVRSVLSVLGAQPKRVDGNFYCGQNVLTSLVGAPASVGGNFSCYGNKLTSLAGAPTVVGGNFWCESNKLTSLAGIHQQIKKIGGQFLAHSNPKLENNLVGLLLIEGLTDIDIDNKEIEKILNKYLGAENKRLAVLQCQQELIEAGFESAADL